MKKSKILLILFILGILYQLTGYSYFSPVWREEYFFIDRQRMQVELAEKPVIAGSVRVWQADEPLDSLSCDIDHYLGLITFDAAVQQIKIEYAIYPEELRGRFFNYQLLDLSDFSTETMQNIKKTVQYKPLELLVKGNKSVSISVSEGKDFQLDQSLFLRISGKLSENVNIQAQVSDSQSPITPEGDSRQISNLDQIFIKLYGRQYELGFGDIEHQFDTSYLDFTPYFEGIKGRWGDQSRITGALGLSRAQNAEISLSGIDGRQGPYWLSNNYGGEALIVPGSERIFLNGIRLQRGDEYTIDYSEGSITFTEEHFISSSDKIYAVYQYGDENYRQQIFLQDSKWKISEEMELGSAVYFKEDDADNPLRLAFSESDLDSLQAAGDAEAYGSGIYETVKGLGEYKLTPEGYYEYVGLDSTGTYNIIFYYEAGGDYLPSEEGSYYIYAGEGAGEYLPGVKLESPEAMGNYAIWAKWQKGDFKLKTEGLISSEDKNTLSGNDDADNLGWAGQVEAGYKRQEGAIRPELELRLEKRSAELFSFDPVTSAADEYETDLLPDTLDIQEISVQAGIDLWQCVIPAIFLRQQRAEDINSQDYFSSGLITHQRGLLPESKYRYLNWNNKLGNNMTEFSSHELEAAYLINWLEAGYRLKQKEKSAEQEISKSRLDHFYLAMKQKNNTGRLYWEQNKEDLAGNSHIRQNTTVGFKGNYNAGRQRLEFDLAHREVKDSVSTEYDLAKLDYNGGIGNLIIAGGHYKIRNLDFYPKVRKLVYVGNGKGSYDEDGDEDAEGDYDLQVVAIDYDSPQKSIELTAAGSLTIKPQESMGKFWNKMRLQAEGSVQEQSTTDRLKELYFLSAEVLLQPETTVYGLQTLKLRWWYELIENKLTLRLASENEERLDNRYQDSEEMHIDREEVYLRWKYIKKLGFEMFCEHRNETDSRYDSQAESYEINLSTRYNPSRLSYDLELKHGWETGNNASAEFQYELEKIEFNQRVYWYWRRNSRIAGQLKYRYNLRNGDDYAVWLKDKRDGSVMVWNIGYNYKMNDYVRLEVEYKGDKYPQERETHEFRMEVSAEF